MHVVGIVAISLDGCVTQHDSEGASFASDADQRYFHQALKSFDCSIFGSGTFRVSQEPILRASSDDHLRVVLAKPCTAVELVEAVSSLIGGLASE